jgi:hypothetical protein
MKQRSFLLTAAVLFAIGFLAAPICAGLHLSQDVSQVIVGINWISGGLACLVLECIKRELEDTEKPTK